MTSPRPDHRPVKAAPTPAKVVMLGAGTIVGSAALLGAGLAAFQAAATITTIVAGSVMVLATGTLLPSIMLGLRAARHKANETVARALPLETLIEQRREFELIITRKAQQLAAARGHLRDMREQINRNNAEMDDAQRAQWEQDYLSSEAALDQADEHLRALRKDADKFDTQIKQARINLQLAATKGQIAQSLEQAQLTVEQRHTQESALSEIARRMGQSAAALDQALDRRTA